ncbi:MAG: acyl-protein synthase [Bacteriovoracaceae bacterium]|jgi:phenylacetate-coenzyme A ligase PaaK-like adenylate-forming protein|nr:acyl-protein synthase [Bacteriovoracaceae bacterium]
MNLTVPEIIKLSEVQKLCEIDHPYNYSAGNDELFLSAMKQSIEWHREKSGFYNSLCETEGFTNSKLKTIGDLDKIPHIFANFFKRNVVKSISDDDITLHLTSSGTTGQKSQMFFDEWTISSAQRMVAWIFDHYKWITPNQKTNYLLYSYEPEEGAKLGTAYTDNFLCEFAPINDVHYALKYMGKGKGHKFDIFGCIESFKKFETEKLPVRIFGFPAFLYFTLKHMKDIGMTPLKLDKESLIFLGGGWKGNQEKAIEKVELYQLVEEMLGIPNKRLRDGFGSVEHCIPYVECEEHKFRIPIYSRILIRDVKTLEPLPEGEIGYLNFISPYITSVPAMSVLMGDLAIYHSGDSNNASPWFEIVGRAGISKNKSCAIKASQLLNEFNTGVGT